MRISLLLLLLSLAPVLPAEIYKWTDEQGRVHYGDRPVVEGAQTLPIRPAPERQSQTTAASDAERAQRRQRLLDIYREERAEKEAEREKSRQEAKQKQDNCRRARLEYDRFSRSRLIYDYQDDGERRYLSDQERDSYVDSLRQAVKRWCGG